ncbi:hypothetical protein EB822_00680 [Flavobacteriaceae bacterium PRS1]|nr:hypothetical protein EB822_00680 [Flavobacteriaceae bacterium PRS1]
MDILYRCAANALNVYAAHPQSIIPDRCATFVYSPKKMNLEIIQLKKTYCITRRFFLNQIMYKDKY